MEKAQKLALQGLSCRGPPACSLRRRREPVAFPGPGLQAQAVPRQAPPLETAATSAEACGSGRVPGARRNARGRLGQGGGRGRGGGGDAAAGRGGRAGRGPRLASAAFRGRLWRRGRATAPKQRAGGPRGGGGRMPRAGPGRQRPDRVPGHAGTA